MSFSLVICILLLFGYAGLSLVGGIGWITSAEKLYLEQFKEKGKLDEWDKCVKELHNPSYSIIFTSGYTIMTAALGWFGYATCFLLIVCGLFIGIKLTRIAIGNLVAELDRRAKI